MRRGKLLLGAALCLVFLSLVLLIVSACKRQPTGSTALFPSSNEVVGWTKTGDVRTFEARDLWKYIDGDAERYLKVGTLRVSTADYKFQNKVDAVVDIYTMGNAEGAAKIFDSEPVGDAKPVQLGESARLYGQSLIFHKGPSLVRIVTYEESGETSQAIMQLGRNIEVRLTR